MQFSRAAFAAAFFLVLSVPALAGDALPQPPDELQKKADSGDAAAMRDLGLFYRKAEGGHWQKAHEWFVKAALKGDAEGEYYAGRDFWYSGGVPRDDKQALKWLQKASKDGSVKADALLGDIYLDGDPVKEPVKRVTPDEKRALALLGKAAAKGDASANYQLGQYYFSKGGDFYPQAFKYYSAAAEAGDARGQSWEGALYAAGYGTPQDLAKSITWYEKAAAQGDIEAEYALAFAYLRGDAGVAKDSAKAAEYFARVDAHDWNIEADDHSLVEKVMEAKYRLGILYRDGEGVTKDPARAARLFDSAARSRSMQGAYLMGRAYEKGEGVPQDKVKAYYWYYMATDGVPGEDDHTYFSSMEEDAPQYDAQKLLHAIAATMTPDEIAQAKTEIAEEERRYAQVDWDTSVMWR